MHQLVQDFEMQMDNLISASQPDTVIVNRKKKKKKKFKREPAE